MGLEDGGDDLAAFRGHMVAVGARDFFDQVMGSQYSQAVAHSRGGAAAFGFRQRAVRGTVQEGNQVAVAEAVDGEFAPVDRAQQGQVVSGPGAQAPQAAAVQHGRFADRLDQVAQRCAGVQCAQGLRVAAVASLADLRASAEVSHAFPHALPVEGAFVVPLGPAIDLADGEPNITSLAHSLSQADQ